jgi:hypothetical protein
VDSFQNIYHEETFGPSLVIIRARDVEDAIRIANDSEVGLSASVWSRDYKQCLDVARRIESGAVHINSMTVHDEPNLPHGGFKVSSLALLVCPGPQETERLLDLLSSQNSGFGRFNGQEAGKAFTLTNTVSQ